MKQISHIYTLKKQAYRLVTISLSMQYKLFAAKH